MLPRSDAFLAGSRERPGRIAIAAVLRRGPTVTRQENAPGFTALLNPFAFLSPQGYVDERYRYAIDFAMNESAGPVAHSCGSGCHSQTLPGKQLMPRLTATPVSVTRACRFVGKYHRHNRPPRFFQFAFGVSVGGKIVGVAIVGSPVSRVLDNGKTLEVRRVCTDGTRNACSFLYGRCVRIAREMGFDSLVTYTLASEPGDSLRAVGARVVSQVAPRRTPKRQWCNRPGRCMQDTVAEAKLRWELMPAAAAIPTEKESCG